MQKKYRRKYSRSGEVITILLVIIVVVLIIALGSSSSKPVANTIQQYQQTPEQVAENRRQGMERRLNALRERRKEVEAMTDQDVKQTMLSKLDEQIADVETALKDES